MQLTKRLDSAIERATVLHHGQSRRITGVPYIVHPYAVMVLLSAYTDDEDVLIAALLHDVIEDVPGYEREHLVLEFGERVASLVVELTEDYTEEERNDRELRRASWRRVKEGYIENLKNDSEEALLIATADKIHNMMSLISGYHLGGEKVLESFHTNSENILWFYGSILELIQKRLSRHGLTLRYQEEFARLESILSVK